MKITGPTILLKNILILLFSCIFSAKITSPLQNSTKIILGIDPGTIVMGFGIISVQGKSISLVDMGVLRLSAKLDAYERLQLIHERVCRLIIQHKPSCFAIEAPFFGKNVQSMLKLGRAQGVAIAAAMQAAVPVTEYSPKKIKQSVTGNGNADKLQVLKMLQTILKFDDDPKKLDASDALAAAVCHHFQESNVLFAGGGAKNDWKSFIAKNPGRIK